MATIHNKKELYLRRKELRKVETKHESKLWEFLRRKQLNGFKFKRQHSIGFYVADFYCAEAKLIVEIDGDSHFTPKGKEYDQMRTQFLNQLNMKVLRFTNEEISFDLENVLIKITQALPPLAPPYKGGEFSA